MGLGPGKKAAVSRNRIPIAVDGKLGVSELRYRRLFETAQDGILIIDLSTDRIIDANPFIANILDYSPDELVGKSLWEIGPFKDIEESKIAFNVLKKQGYVRYEDLPLQTKDGKKVHVEFVSNVYTVGDRKVAQCNIRDIKDRKAAWITASALAAIVDSSNDAIIGKDLNGKVLSWNAAATRMYGYTEEEVRDKPISLLIPPDRLDEYHSILEKIKTGLRIEYLETERITKDRKTIPVALTVSPIKNSAGEVIGASAIARDITERKRLLDKIESLARFPSENPNPVFRIGKERKIVDENEATKSLFPLLGLDTGGTHLKFLCDTANQLLSTGTSKTFEIELGEKIYSFFAQPNLDSGDVNFYGRDITELKRLERQLLKYSEHLEAMVTDRTAKLAESEEKYRSLVENIPSVVWINHETKTVYMSPNVLKVTGYAPEEIITNELFGAIKIHPDDQPRVKEAFEDLLSRDKRYDIEYRMQRKDGKWIWVHERAMLIHQLEGARYTYGIFTDVTERKRLEEELRSAREHLEFAVFSNPAVIYVGKPLPDQSDFWATFISKSVGSVLGFEAEQLTGESGAKFWASRLPAEDLQKFRAEVPLLWRNGQHAFEYRFLHKDGRYRWIREEQRVIRDEEGNLRDVVGYWIDITEQKKLEEALRTSEMKLRKANEDLELGIVETTQQIESIAKLREKLRQTPDLSTGLETVLETIIWEFGMEIGAIFAFDRAKRVATLQALKTRSGDVVLQETYSLDNGFIEFEVTPTKNITKLVTEDDNSLLQTKSVHSISITVANEVYGVLALGGNKTEKLSDIDLIILDFYTELISQTITERRLTVKPVREKPLEAKAPTSWPTPRDFKTPKLELGCIYITKNDHSFAYETFSKIVLAGSEGLCITREHPSKMKKRLGLEKTPIVWLTGEASPNETTISSLQDLSITLGDFLEKAEHPIILLDGFEYLITNATFESFLKFLQLLRDRVQSHDAIMIAPISEKALEPRALGLIEAESTRLEQEGKQNE